MLGFGCKNPGVGAGPVGVRGHEATLQHVGSFGSGTRVQLGGTLGYFAHLQVKFEVFRFCLFLQILH